MKEVQCKNCKYFIRDIFYKNEGVCNNDGRYTREHRVCNLLNTDEKKREAKIKKTTYESNFKTRIRSVCTDSR